MHLGSSRSIVLIFHTCSQGAKISIQTPNSNIAKTFWDAYCPVNIQLERTTWITANKRTDGQLLISKHTIRAVSLHNFAINSVHRTRLSIYHGAYKDMLDNILYNSYKS